MNRVDLGRAAIRCGPSVAVLLMLVGGIALGDDGAKMTFDLPVLLSTPVEAGVVFMDWRSPDGGVRNLRAFAFCERRDGEPLAFTIECPRESGEIGVYFTSKDARLHFFAPVKMVAPREEIHRLVLKHDRGRSPLGSFVAILE